jgi:predicted permease
LTTGVVWLGQATMPLALMLIGAVIVDELRPNGNNALPKGDMAKWLAWSCLVRLGIFPLLFLLGVVYLPATDELKRVIAVQAAMPSAVFSIIMTRVYSGQPGIALRIVLVTSLVSLITIPFWIPFGLEWLGVVSGN